MNSGSDVFSRSTVPLWILAVLATLFFLRAAQELVIPLAIGILVSYALEPVVAWLERHRVPRFAGAVLVLLMVLAAAVAGAYSFRDDAARLAAALPRAMQRVGDMISMLGPGQSVIDGTTGLLTAIVAVAGHLVVIFFLVFFLLISGHHVRDRVIEIAGAERRRVTATIIDDVNAQIQRYLLVLLVTGTIVGVATWLVLAWMRVEHAAIWGLLAGLFNSIPYFGPVIVSGGLFAIGMAQGGIQKAILASGAALLITSLEGWLITPPLMGKAEHMNVLAVFVGLLLWTWVWGGWGTILAVPMLVIIKSVADHVESLRSLGRLMAP
jgi:predicted PurR-regulated permease PerM